MLEAAIVLIVLATLMSFWAYQTYGKDLVRTTPNRWSWMIWFFTTIVEALTYQAVNENLIITGAFFCSAFFCAVMTVKIWRKLKWVRPDTFECFSIIASVAAVVIWMVWHENWWAHVVAIIAIPVSFVPALKDAFRDPEGEYSSAWWKWTVSDFLMIVAVLFMLRQANSELPYVVVEFVMHAAMWLLVTFGVMSKRHHHAAKGSPT